MSNDDTGDDDGRAFGFAIPIPESVRQQHDHAHMQAEDLQRRAFALVESLPPDQLIALRWILNQDSSSAMNNYWDGQIVAILRVHHGVDHVSGLTPQETLEREAARG